MTCMDPDYQPRDTRCPECGEMMTSHIVVTRHATGPCDERFHGPELRTADAPIPCSVPPCDDADARPYEPDVRAKARQVCINLGLNPACEDAIVETFEELLRLQRIDGGPA